ncbi:hypothetical protein [Streptomyces sp. 2A115]|uniref:hypothetical protein n=1 Tax=Streptomyces sp. 2A115 TaxID=3457439 RepID=UPI003FD17A70
MSVWKWSPLVVVGLFAPPLSATTAIGAGAGRLTRHKTAGKLGEQMSATALADDADLFVLSRARPPTKSSLL